MLLELETEIIAAIKASPYANNLRVVDALPDLTPETIKRIAVNAPAVYVVAGDYNIGDRVDVSFDLLCFARNAGGNNAARRGDSTAIGLYPLMDAVSFHFCSLPTLSAIWSASKGRFLRQGAWAAAGLNPGVITINAKVMPDRVDISAMGDFLTFHGDYDLEPFTGSSEHAKWLQEPADHSTSAPDLTDTINL